MASVEGYREARGARRLKRRLALAIGVAVAVAGAPTAAVPGAGVTGIAREAGPAAALVVDAVLRVTADDGGAQGAS